MPQVRVSVDGRLVSTLSPGSDGVIGRDPSASVVVSHPLVSRRHARIWFDQVWILEDLGSANGTWMQGSEIRQVSLASMHEARLGGPDDGPILHLELVAPGVPDATPALVQASDPAPGAMIAPPPVPPPHHAPGPPSANPGRPMVIGRHPDCDIVLDDPMTSGRHAQLTQRSGHLWITDLNSTNQTIVNGDAVTERMLTDGDKLLIGNTHLLVRGGQLVPDTSGGLVVRDAVLALNSGRRIVDGISFTVERPSVVAIIGPSGAGKSSLLRLLTGQVPPTSGVVDFRDASMVSQRKAFRGEIGVVPQYTIAHGQLTARQALDYTARLRFADDVSATDRRRRIEAVVDQLGLTAHADTRVDRLSGGQQRRVSIAMELLTEPTMLILDEPTSGLDPSLVLQIMQLLREFSDAGKQVLVVTHDLEHLDLVDKVVVLRAGGTVAYEGPPAGVFPHFKRSSWAAVFTDLAHPKPAGPPSLARPTASASFSVPIPPMSLGQVLSRALAVAGRQMKVMLADPVYVGLMFGMPIVLALLALAIPADNGLSPVAANGGPPDAGPGRLLSILIIGAAFLGLAGAIRDLVAEKLIYRHEREAGLPPLSYLLAKSVVLSVVAVVQAFVLVAIVLAVRADPADSVFFLPSFVEILVAVTMTAVCCVMLGLAVSARVGTTEQTTPPLVLLVMGQLVLCGGLFPIAGRAVLEQLAWLAPARWGYAAAAATTDLNLVAEQSDGLWNHEPGPWVLALFMSTVLTGAFWFLAYLGVAKREKFG